MFNWAPMYVSYWHWIGCCVGSSIRAEYKRNSLTPLFVNFTLKGFVGWAEPIGLSSPKTSTITFFGLTSVLSLQARSLLQIIACHLSVLLGKEQIVKYGVGPKCEGGRNVRYGVWIKRSSNTRARVSNSLDKHSHFSLAVFCPSTSLCFFRLAHSQPLFGRDNRT